MRLPKTLGEIDGDWLYSALRAHGVDPPRVTTVRYEPLAGVVGMMGEIGTLSVEYAEPTDLPRRFIGKCPRDDETARRYNKLLGAFRRESGFYRDLAREIPFRVPRCWVNAASGDDVILVLEHLGAAVPGDLITGASFETMQRLALDLGRVHGHYWSRAELLELAWLPDWSDPSIASAAAAVFAESWPRAADRHPDLFPRDFAEMAARTIVADTARCLQEFAARPWTLTHGDFHLDNMMFLGDEIIILDWARPQRSFPGYDLAYLLASSATPETIAREPELFDSYRQALREHGGPDWTTEELLDDLAFGVLWYATGLTGPYTTDYTGLGIQGERLRQRFSKVLHGCIDAATRWRILSRLQALS